MNCCCNLIYSSSITSNGTNVVITIPNAVFTNGQTVSVKLVQAMPAVSGQIPVIIAVDGQNCPLLKPCGNNVMSDQIRYNKTYVLRVGTNPNHFTVKNCNSLCGTAYIAPQLLPS